MCRCSSISKDDGRRGTFEEDLDRCLFGGRRSTRDMFIRHVRKSGRWFPERGCILEHQIFSFGKMILCDRCGTLYDLASLYRGRRNTSETWAGKIAKRIGTRPSALHSIFLLLLLLLPLLLLLLPLLLLLYYYYYYHHSYNNNINYTAWHNTALITLQHTTTTNANAIKCNYNYFTSHNSTLHYTNYITSRYSYKLQQQLQLQF